MADSKQLKSENISTADLALKCSQFFISLGEYCLEFYHKHNKQAERKTKMIKKTKKVKAKVNKKQGEDGSNNEEEMMMKKFPKKPLTAYIIYFQQKKPNFVERHPGLNLSELTKLIAKQWKQINDEERRPYLQQAQEDRKRYEQQMKQFKLKHGTINNEDEDEQEIEQELAPIQKSEAKQSEMKAQGEQNEGQSQEQNMSENGGNQNQEDKDEDEKEDEE